MWQIYTNLRRVAYGDLCRIEKFGRKGRLVEFGHPEPAQIEKLVASGLNPGGKLYGVSEYSDGSLNYYFSDDHDVLDAMVTFRPE